MLRFSLLCIHLRKVYFNNLFIFRYVLDFNRTFGVNSLYYQSIAGAANMTGLHDGSPVSITLFLLKN